MLKITVITLGNKMPDWVAQGSNEYAKRFNDGISLKIIEIPLLRRTAEPVNSNETNCFSS